MSSPLHSQADALCHINDIPDGGSKGFVHQGLHILALKQESKIFLYVNRCPHLGIPLEWKADQFLNHDNTLIQCNTHGALFLIDTGECISGPCSGDHLEPIDFEQQGNYVFLSDKK